MPEPAKPKVTVPWLVARKAAGEKIVALTAYDFPVARILDEAGVDLILVGDSLGMVVLGYENTLPVTMEEMLHHTRAVVRGVRRALVVADMPFLSFQVAEEEAVRNAGRFVKDAGAHAVKIEGASPSRLRLVERLREAGIPVVGHVGLVPQSLRHFGEFRVQGGDAASALRLVGEAESLERAGCFAVVLECIPLEVAREITTRLRVPTIGIGAGPHCDGQIIVFHDLMGCTAGYLPKFVKTYADLGGVIRGAASAYGADVRAGGFPGDAQSYHLKAEAAAAFARSTAKPPRRRKAAGGR